MVETDPLHEVRAQLQEGMALRKCRRCGCMQDTLESLLPLLTSLEADGAEGLGSRVERWTAQMEPIRYACLGCDHCFPAVAMNRLQDEFPAALAPGALHCAFETDDRNWPAVAGEYHAFCDGPGCPVAVSTLASVELAETLALSPPQGLCIVGKTETENIGIDKLVKNIATNPTIRVLLLAGEEADGHRSGSTLRSLWQNGVDDAMRAIGSPARRPILKNVSRDDIEAVRQRVQMVDMVGCKDETRIIEAINDLQREFAPSCGCEQSGTASPAANQARVPTIHAQPPARVKLDKAGYFVILPQAERGRIVVEYYSYDNALNGIIEGSDARGIYWTIIDQGWVTELSHAAYLGKELAKAERSLQSGDKYVQDGA